MVSCFIVVSLVVSSEDNLPRVTAFPLRTKQSHQSARAVRLTPLPSLCRLSSASPRVVSWRGHGSVLRRSMTSCWAAGRGNRSSDWTLRTFRRSFSPWEKPRRSTWTSWASGGSRSSANRQMGDKQTDRLIRIQEITKPTCSTVEKHLQCLEGLKCLQHFWI